MELAIAIAIGIIGFIAGVVVGKRSNNQSISGTLRIDSSDPYDGPYMFLELSEDLVALSKKQHVTLDVSTESYISRK